MSKQIVVVKPKTLSSKDKAKLTKEGNVVIEHEKGFEIIYHQDEEHLPFVYTNCYTCGCRIYMQREVMVALKANYHSFYCVYGHSQAYVKLKQ